MDIIFLDKVEVQTKLGVPEWERMLPQTIILDIEISYDLANAGKSDSIADTIDYGAVVGRIRSTLNNHSFQLVEALAEHVCQLILLEFAALHVKIKVAKPGILPGLGALGVIIERSRII
jgi:dihydroneopterin aldolase